MHISQSARLNRDHRRSNRFPNKEVGAVREPYRPALRINERLEIGAPENVRIRRLACSRRNLVFDLLERWGRDIALVNPLIV